MKSKSKIGVICITILAVFVTLFAVAQTYADNTKYIGIVAEREGGETYTIVVGNEEDTVWKLVKYNSADPTETPDFSEAIYCIYPEVGFTPTDKRVPYDESFSMKAFLDDASISAEDKTRYTEMFEEMYGTNYHEKYNQVLWVLDNSYVPKQTSELTKRLNKEILFNAVVEKLSNDDPDYDVEDGRACLEKLTDNDIEVIQQLAIWFFSSVDGSHYHVLPENLNTIKLNTIGINIVNEDRYLGMKDLYRYFVESGTENANYYGTGNTKGLQAPVVEFISPENDSTKTKMANLGDIEYFIAGPFKYNETTGTKLPYTLEGMVVDQNGDEISDYKLLEEAYSSVSTAYTDIGTTEVGKNLLNREFYIAVPATNNSITKIRLVLTGNYVETTSNVWINGDHYPHSGETEPEQPVAIVTKDVDGFEAAREVTVFRPIFDLSLRKFITKINNDAVTTRIPDVDVSGLIDGSKHTATYTHPKDAITVKTDDLVEYTIRVYNEGEMSGYASEITDYIPEGLEYVIDNETNIEYKWRLSEDETKITTDYLSMETDDDNILTAFDRTNGESGLDYKDVKVVFKVTEPGTSNRVLRNIAEITDDANEFGNPINDKDSTTNNVDLEDYTPPADNSEYQEDDDDYEQLKLEHFDLSLRKFITKINSSNITNRVPEVDVSGLVSGSKTTATYTHPKNAIGVKTGDIVQYTIRVYNEGKIDGKAIEIVDYIPEGLRFIEDSETNIRYNWTLSTDEKSVTTDYLKDTVISAFARNTEGAELDYEDLLIEFEVTEPITSNRVLRNIAEIAEDSDDDADSVPDNVDLDDYTPPADNSEYQEDDDDYELLKLEYFDLSLRKFITKIDDTEITTRIPEVDVTKLLDGSKTTATYTHPKNVVGVYNGAKIVYTIRVYNEGRINGTATEIVDYIPEGLKFIADSEINQEFGWELSANETEIRTSYLADKTISAFNRETGIIDYKDVKVEFEVIEPSTSNRVLRNIAEITQDSNDDVDSVPDNVDLDDYNPPVDNSEYQEDDDDYEEINLQYFDLSLRKFITKVNTTEINSRIPTVDLSKLTDGSKTTATYTHPKAPITVRTGDMVVYTIRVYNEGKVDGYAREITDHIPEGLKFAENSSINSTYKWTLSEDGKSATTDYLKDTVIESFKPEHIPEVNVELDYKDVLIEFEVIEPNTSERILRNIAEISEDSAEDIDSIPDNVDLDNYNPPADNSEYQEDDDDYEQLKLESFDLSLRKFITKINDEKVTTRVPEVDVTGLVDGSKHTATYTHPKTALVVKTGDNVVYTIRVYNEGKLDGFVKEVTDHIPAGLQFVTDSNINTAYGWNLSEDGKTATTDYLKDTVIRAFDKTAETPALDYKDVQIELKVVATETNSLQTLTNIAEISEDSDDDVDSTPDNADLDNYNPPADNSEYQEDDDDYEPVELLPKAVFDLSLRKFITKINNDDITTRVPEVDISKLEDGSKTTATYTHPKNAITVKTGDMVVYTIRVYNEGRLDGTATEITDYIPEGLKFVENSSINSTYKWVLTEEGKVATTDYLKDTIITAHHAEDGNNPLPLDYKDVQIELEVIATKTDKEQVLRNIAEISEDSDDDRDSTPDNVDLDSYNPPADNSEYQEDDDDYEPVKLEPEEVKVFDLSLRKFITKINSNDVTSRLPEVDVSGLLDGSKHTATYTHPKSAITVKTGDMVVYTIRVYNEGNVDGTATEVTDYVPDGLKFVENSTINSTYKWTVSEDGKTVSTDYLKDTVIKAFDKTTENPALDYKDVEIEFEVIAEVTTEGKVLRNIAEVTEDSNDDNDSTPDNVDLDDYKPGPDNSEYQEDDDDYEQIKLVPEEVEKIFDLSLRKFITKINSDDVDTRYPVVTLDEDEKLVYTHPKDPILVASNDIVVYTIRVYNEGEIAGYAKEISDDIPNGLSYLPEHEINKKYNWTVSEDGQTVSTDYLSKEKSEEREEDNLLKAFDALAEVSDTNPDHRDVQIAFKVIETNLATDRIIINTAEITDDSDEDGNDVEDKDSTPGNNEPDEDDIDKEYLKVKYFDLSLLKWVSKTYVTENDKTTTKETGHTGLENPEPVVKVDLDRKNLSKVTVKFGYTIKITNEGEIAGYAKEVSDYIPEGLKFVKEDNPDWEEKEGKIVTRKLENTLLNPGESATVEVILTWINGENNLDLKVNVAEISEDYNEHGSKDIDSIPNNKKDGEDDIDDAPVILTIRTGSEPTYIILAISILLISVVGMALVKKYVIM